MIKAVIFDMDGIIVDTEPLYLEATNRILRKYGKKLKEKDYCKYVGVSSESFWNKMKMLYQLPESAREYVEQRIEITNELIERKLQTYFGFEQLFKELKNNKYKIAIASSSYKTNVMKVISKLNLDVDSVLYAEKIEKHKPNPEIYQRTAEELGLEPNECVAIEDSQYGVSAAIAAGMFCIAIPNKYTRVQDHSKATLILESLSKISVETLKKIGE